MERIAHARIRACSRGTYIRKALAWIDRDLSKEQKAVSVRIGRVRVDSHFAKTDPTVRATYQRLIDVARALGPVTEDPKKTSIHLVRHTAFAGVATRRSSLILTLKSASDIRSPRIQKREQTSANRWHFEVRLEKPAHVDRQVTTWLRAAYDLAASRS
jgi:hypothetical protein